MKMITLILLLLLSINTFSQECAKFRTPEQIAESKRIEMLNECVHNINKVVFRLKFSTENYNMKREICTQHINNLLAYKKVRQLCRTFHYSELLEITILGE